MGEPPAGIERHAEAVDRPAPEQSFKAHLGGHHIDRLRPLEQRGRVQPIGRETNAGMVEVRRVEMTTGATAEHVRVQLHHHQAVGVVIQGRLQHPAEAAAVGKPQGNREIPR